MEKIEWLKGETFERLGREWILRSNKHTIFKMILNYIVIISIIKSNEMENSH